MVGQPRLSTALHIRTVPDSVSVQSTPMRGASRGQGPSTRGQTEMAGRNSRGTLQKSGP